MNIPNTKTITEIGSKEVNIKTHWQEMIHVTTILWIVADGTRLSTMLVFKDQPDSRVKRRLHKNSLLLILNMWKVIQTKWSENIKESK